MTLVFKESFTLLLHSVKTPPTRDRLSDHYDEIFDFARACIRKGWTYDETCDALGISQDDHYIIYEAYTTCDPCVDDQ